MIAPLVEKEEVTSLDVAVWSCEAQNNPAHAAAVERASSRQPEDGDPLWSSFYDARDEWRVPCRGACGRALPFAVVGAWWQCAACSTLEAL
jgi:hypothetical protein